MKGNEMAKTTFELEGFVFELSRQSIGIYYEHQAFCSAGREWLLEFDADGEREFDIIDRFKQSVEADLIVAMAHMSEDEQEDLLDLLIYSPKGDDAFYDYFEEANAEADAEAEAKADAGDI
jgi:hypothetical protein